MNRKTALFMALAVLPCSVCFSEVIQLRGGGSITGAVTPVTIGKQNLYVVDLGDGMKISVAKGDVARIVNENEALAEYRTRLANTPEDAEAHWQLARWCKSNTLLNQYDRHVRHVIRLDPNHKSARGSLGYTMHDGRWVLYDELQRSRGLVRHLNKWKVPADVAMSEAAEQHTIKQKEWLRKINRYRGMLGRGGKQAAEARAELEAIRDPLAGSAIGEKLRERKDPDMLRMLWVKLLSQWDTAEAVDALILASLFDPDPGIREACFDRLEVFGKTRAVNTYITLLRDPDNKKVRIAAHALRAMKDPSSILPLIDALVTEHKIKVGGGPGMSSTFDKSGNGGGGFTFGGGKEKIVKQDVENPPVLSALLTMAPDVDFQYDEARWRLYFSEAMSNVSFQLRRDL